MIQQKNVRQYQCFRSGTTFIFVLIYYHITIFDTYVIKSEKKKTKKKTKKKQKNKKKKQQKNKKNMKSVMNEHFMFNTISVHNNNRDESYYLQHVN